MRGGSPPSLSLSLPLFIILSKTPTSYEHHIIYHFSTTLSTAILYSTTNFRSKWKPRWISAVLGTDMILITLESTTTHPMI